MSTTSTPSSLNSPPPSPVSTVTASRASSTTTNTSIIMPEDNNNIIIITNNSGNMKEEQLTLLGLPLELKRRTCSFLTISEALNLAQTCQSLHANLALTSLKPARKIFSRLVFDTTTAAAAANAAPENPFFFWPNNLNNNNNNNQGNNNNNNQRNNNNNNNNNNNDRPRTRKSIRIPVWNRRVHSMTLSFTGAGAGSSVCIVAKRAKKSVGKVKASKGTNTAATTTTTSPERKRRNSNSSSSMDRNVSTTEDFGGGRMVCRLALQSVFRNEKLTFVPQEGEIYHLWIAAANPGTEQQQHRPPVQLDNGYLRVVIFDDEAKNLSRNFFTLHKVGALSYPTTCAAEDTSNNNNNHNHGRPAFFRDFFQVGVHPNNNNNDPRGDNQNVRTVSSTSTSSQSISTTTTPSPTHFYPRMLLRVSKLLRKQLALAARVSLMEQQQVRGVAAGGTSSFLLNQYLDEELVSFMEEFDIPVNEASLLAVEEIVQANLSEQASILQEKQARNRRLERHSSQSSRGGGGGDLQRRHTNNNNNVEEDSDSEDDDDDNNNNNNNNNHNNIDLADNPILGRIVGAAFQAVDLADQRFAALENLGFQRIPFGGQQQRGGDMDDAAAAPHNFPEQIMQQLQAAGLEVMDVFMGGVIPDFPPAPVHPPGGNDVVPRVHLQPDPQAGHRIRPEQQQQQRVHVAHHNINIHFQGGGAGFAGEAAAVAAAAAAALQQQRFGAMEDDDDDLDALPPLIPPADFFRPLHNNNNQGINHPPPPPPGQQPQDHDTNEVRIHVQDGPVLVPADEAVDGGDELEQMEDVGLG